MKKMTKAPAFILLILAITIIFTACGNKETQKAEATKSNEKKTESVTLKKDIPEGNFTEMGKGKFYILNESGTSENGNIPVFMIEKDCLAGGNTPSTFDISFEAWDFDGTKPTKIYVDGVCQTTEQLGDTQSSFSVDEKLKTVGKHKVEALQLDDNNKVVTYKSAEFEIKVLK